MKKSFGVKQSRDKFSENRSSLCNNPDDFLGSIKSSLIFRVDIDGDWEKINFSVYLITLLTT